MVVLKSVALVPLTKELAVKFATMPGVPGERERKRGRVAHFAALAREGTEFNLQWSTAICRDTGEEYRFDGQHTSYALSQLTDEEFPAGWNVSLFVFEIDSKTGEDAVELYNRFDSPDAARWRGGIAPKETDEETADSGARESGGKPPGRIM